MVRENRKFFNLIEDDEIVWTVTLMTEISVSEGVQAMDIVQLLLSITDDDWCGDSDKKKNTDWDFLIVNRSDK